MVKGTNEAKYLSFSIQSQIISYWVYPSEEHEVTTANGYILQLNQIPHGKNDANHLGRHSVIEKDESQILNQMKSSQTYSQHRI